MNRVLRLPSLRRFSEFTAIDELNLPYIGNKQEELP